MNTLENNTVSKNYFEIVNPNYYFTHRYNKSSNKDVLSRHTHDSLEIVFIKHGFFYYHYEGQNIAVADNDLILTPAHTYHYYQTSDDTEYERYIIQIKNKTLATYLTPTTVEKINIGNNPILKSVFDSLDYYCKHYNTLSARNNFNNTIFLQLELLLVNLSLVETFDQKQMINTHQRIRTDADSNEFLTRILKYINDDLSKIQKAEDVTSHFNMSKSYLFRLFNQYLKISFNQYLTQKKMILAKSLIENGNKLNYVAVKCGYPDYTTFYRNYVKFFRSQPSHKQNASIQNKE